MNFSNMFGFLSGSTASEELPNLYPLAIAEADFVAIDIRTIYKKILTDTFERSTGLTDEMLNVLWDNCLASESRQGLVTVLADAMIDKKEVFLVYDKATKVLRKANQTEESTIKKDYETQAQSATGVFISFKNIDVSDMVKIYSAVEYCSVSALYKGMNVSKAVQIKIDSLRASTGLADSSIAEAQMSKIAKGLKAGKDVGMDVKDKIEMAAPDLKATQSSMELTNQKRAFYLNMPASYITGILNGGLGDTGQADAKAVERGLKGYFFSIAKPVCKAIFNVDLEFKSDDFQQLATSLEALKTFDITSDEHLSAENKTVIINKLFGLPEDEEGDAPAKPDTTVPPADPNAKPAAVPVPPKG